MYLLEQQYAVERPCERIWGRLSHQCPTKWVGIEQGYSSKVSPNRLQEIQASGGASIYNGLIVSI